jgi:RNA polymerase sigma-70 factor (ECF subfamily)
MQRYQQSDGEAAAMLVAQLSPQIYNFFRAREQNPQIAEDLVQDFWLRVHTARRTYRPYEPVLPWIYAIARRVRIDHYRRNRMSRHHEMQAAQLPEKTSQLPPPGKSPNLTDLLEILPAAQQEIILLLKVSGLSLEEVARATGTTVGAVKQKAHRAYEKLRKAFGTET